MNRLLFFGIIILMLIIGIKLFSISKDTIFLSSQKAPLEKVINNSAPTRSTLVYFTGVGCPHCAKVDPIIFKEKLPTEDLLILEYEIYQSKGNASLLIDYNRNYGLKIGIPQLIGGTKENANLSGETSIARNINTFLLSTKGNLLALPDKSISFEDLDLATLPRSPKIWYKNRIAIKVYSDSKANQPVKDFILNGAVPDGVIEVTLQPVDISGDKMEFTKAYTYDGWMLMSRE